MNTQNTDYERLVELGRNVDNCERHGSDWCSCKVRQYLDLLLTDEGWLLMEGAFPAHNHGSEAES